MKLPNLFPEHWFPSPTPSPASGMNVESSARFQPMYFSSRSGGGGDDGGYDDDEPSVSEDSTDTSSRGQRSRGASGRGNDGGRQRTIQFQPDDRYWTEYLRIALPIIGLILMLGLFWFWATRIIGDDTDNTTDPVETPPGEVVTTEATDIPPTEAPTDAVANTPEVTEAATDGQATEAPAGDEPTEEASSDEPTEEPVDEESTGGAFASGDTVLITEDGVRMRSEPSTEGEVVQDNLEAGTEFTIVEGPEEGNDLEWYEVTDGDLQGWVAADFLEAGE